jgi:hypothetical protein
MLRSTPETTADGTIKQSDRRELIHSVPMSRKLFGDGISAQFVGKSNTFTISCDTESGR